MIFQVYSPLTEEETDSGTARDSLRIPMQPWGYARPEPGSGDAQPGALSLATRPLLPDGEGRPFHLSAGPQPPSPAHAQHPLKSVERIDGMKRRTRDTYCVQDTVILTSGAEGTKDALPLRDT